MIRAGNYTVEDKGFSVTTARMGGTYRQALVMELPGAITEEELAALCAGPIEVLDENGEVAYVHEGPFGVSSHHLKLVRESADSDVAVLTTRVATLEAELAETKSAKSTALADLASVTAQFNELKLSVASAAKETDTEGGVEAEGGLSLGTVTTEVKAGV